VDDRRFDDLARLIGTGTSRRRLLRLLTGGLAGGWAVAARVPAPAAAGEATCAMVGEECVPGEPNSGCCCGTTCGQFPDGRLECVNCCIPEGGDCGQSSLPGCNFCCNDLACVDVGG
jgi:hypothetical protein